MSNNSIFSGLSFESLANVSAKKIQDYIKEYKIKYARVSQIDSLLNILAVDAEKLQNQLSHLSMERQELVPDMRKDMKVLFGMIASHVDMPVVKETFSTDNQNYNSIDVGGIERILNGIRNYKAE